MFEKHFSKNIKKDEKVVKLVRQFPAIYGMNFAISLFLIILSFFLIYPLVQLGAQGLILFGILLIAGIIYGIKTFYIYSLTAILITTKRIIDFDQKGLLHQQVSEACFENIEDISYNKRGIWATMFNYGSLAIQTAGEKANLEMHGVRAPEKIQSIITDLQHAIKEKKV